MPLSLSRSLIIIAMLVCVNVEAAPVETSDAGLIEQADILALNDQMRSLVDLFVKPVHNPETRARALMDLMFNTDKMAIEYDGGPTKTAMETVRSGSGNCLSLANAYIAMARYAGLDAVFLAVSLPDVWTEENNTFYLRKHTTAAVKVRRKMATMEFSWLGPTVENRSRIISDERAFAEFYSNLGVEYLERGELPVAIDSLHRAIQIDGSYAAAWSNLGVVYKRMNMLPESEHAYKQALRIEPHNITSLSNLASLYVETGNTKFAEKYQRKLERYRRKNPYYLIRLAENALDERRYEDAVRLARMAIGKQKYEDRFYFTLAKAYAYLGETKQVERYLKEALQYSSSEEQQSRYRSKLETISRLYGGAI